MNSVIKMNSGIFYKNINCHVLALQASHRCPFSSINIITAFIRLPPHASLQDNRQRLSPYQPNAYKAMVVQLTPQIEKPEFTRNNKGVNPPNLFSDETNSHNLISTGVEDLRILLKRLLLKSLKRMTKVGGHHS
ncbi:hypothetical protein M8C21_018452 [Ambrosia artemisiifolia]|uniref:Uncharacterized protein n=1 Tax=Ambrosia artemisiifolia TaxID=4212 RepID=A0AAD5BZE8_AMBAR|nr:hypothetical protein M8C21_018452 [Ambrosia artemisiifolia]